MQLHTLDETCALLHIDQVTLRRWMCRANISPGVDPSDRRRRHLDDAQLVQLAEAHHRVIVWLPAPGQVELVEQIAGLRKRIEVLETILVADRDGDDLPGLLRLGREKPPSGC